MLPAFVAMFVKGTLLLFTRAHLCHVMLTLEW